MSGGDGSDQPKTGRLALAVGVAVAIIAFVVVWLTGQQTARFRDETYPVTRGQCCKYTKADEKALEVQAREAVTSDDALDVSLFQAALGAAGLAAVGLTVYYAQRAWHEAQRSANAAHLALKHMREDAEEQARRFDHQAALAKEAAESAAKSATAMESVAASMTINANTVVESVSAQKKFWSAQMRAYVGIAIGGASFQDRENDIRFEARPLLVNTGATPAHDLRFQIRGEILPFSAPENLRLSLPSAAKRNGGIMLRPNHPLEMTATLTHFVDDDRVARIKRGLPYAFHVWGVVSYRDVLGKRHLTTFYFIQHWVQSANGEIIKGLFMEDHNRAN